MGGTGAVFCSACICGFLSTAKTAAFVFRRAMTPTSTSAAHTTYWFAPGEHTLGNGQFQNIARLRGTPPSASGRTPTTPTLSSLKLHPEQCGRGLDLRDQLQRADRVRHIQPQWARAGPATPGSRPAPSTPRGRSDSRVNTNCGCKGVFSEYGNDPSGSPYQGDLVPTNIAFHQDNIFSANTYNGPRCLGWQLGTSVSFSQWRGANVANAQFGQDAKSAHTGASWACS
jgi:hypothetical protein